MPKATRFIVKLCLICFGVACLYWFATANVNEICGAWCSGRGRPIPGVDEWYGCIVDCSEVLR